MLTLFVLSGFWLWVTLASAMVWFCVASYHEKYVQATIDLVLLVGILSITGNFDAVGTWGYIHDNPLHIVLAAVLYLCAGVVWARVKWSLTLQKIKDSAAYIHFRKKEAELEGQVRVGGSEDIPYELSRKGLKRVDGKLTVPVDTYKSRIIGWISYWPVSALVWVIGDFVADLMNLVYRWIRGHFQSVADSTFE